jgi:nicotinamidase-related amidase
MTDPEIPGALLLCLDMQTPFLEAVTHGAELSRRCELALLSAQGLGLPCALTEQVPTKLGGSTAAISPAAGEAPVFAKSTFSALADPAIAAHLQTLAVEHLILCGLETPICVYQTAIDALNQDIAVTVLSDACGARRPEDASAALDALKRLGAHVLPVETVVYAMLHDTSHPFFKPFTKLVKTYG